MNLKCAAISKGDCQKMNGELMYSVQDDRFYMWDGMYWSPLKLKLEELSEDFGYDIRVEAVYGEGKNCLYGKGIVN